MAEATASVLHVLIRPPMRREAEVIEVTEISGEEPMIFDVVVREDDGASRHRVTLSRADYIQLGGACAPQDVICAAFLFLLDREPKEAILSRFDVSLISQYFPEFASDFPAYVTQAAGAKA